MRRVGGWRSGMLGSLLGVHSPLAHDVGSCWCDNTYRQLPAVRIYSEYLSMSIGRIKNLSAPYTNQFGYCDDPFCDITDGHKHGDLCHTNCSCKGSVTDAGWKR